MQGSTPTTTEAATGYSRLSLDLVSPPAARITLRNPPLNVIDIPMMEDLSRALSEIDARPELPVIVLEGAGRAFSAGVDVAAHSLDKVEEMLTKFHAVVKTLVASRKLIIAVVRGACLGGGAELAIVCDIVYTADSAQWGFPEIKLGCYPPVGCTALAALIGHKPAAELILTGRSISGEAAAALRLATRAVPQRELAATVQAAIDDLSHLSPAALAITKKAMYAWDSVHFDKGLARAEKTYLEELRQTADAQEGIRAFLEKRQPVWKGK
jgi:cyclohexa-1,5-dienecarbonyl-CoA hydratase